MKKQTYILRDYSGGVFHHSNRFCLLRNRVRHGESSRSEILLNLNLDIPTKHIRMVIIPWSNLDWLKHLRRYHSVRSQVFPRIQAVRCRLEWSWQKSEFAHLASIVLAYTIGLGVSALILDRGIFPVRTFTDYLGQPSKIQTVRLKIVLLRSKSVPGQWIDWIIFTVSKMASEKKLRRMIRTTMVQRVCVLTPWLSPSQWPNLLCRVCNGFENYIPR